MKFSGIDLHSNNSVVVVSDEEDRIVYQKRLPNNLEQIRAALAPYRDELAGVVVESTYNWYFLVDGLMDAGYRVHLANTTAIKKYEVPRVEEVAVGKGRILNRLRMRLHGAARGERREFRVGFAGANHM